MLQRQTEGRVPVFSHEVVPDHLRTKPDPEVEEQEKQLTTDAARIGADAAQVGLGHCPAAPYPKFYPRKLGVLPAYGRDVQLVSPRLPPKEHKEETSLESFLACPNRCTHLCVLQKQIQSLNKMCSNLLEKISKEERESEGGGTEGAAAERRREEG